MSGAAASGLELGLVATAVGLGFRHGIDWDHIAALTDITSSQDGKRRSMTLATMYAVGHAAVVFVLGVVALVLSAEIPSWLDEGMTRVVGLTLVGLGVYVIVSLIRDGREFRLRSRWMLVFAGARRATTWARRRGRSAEPVVITHAHDHPEDHHHDIADHHLPSGGAGQAPHVTHARAAVGTVAASAGVVQPAVALTAVVPTEPTRVPRPHSHLHHHIAVLPDDPFPTYGVPTALGIGALHGIGAETPTQVLVFLAAAHAGGTAVGITLLLCFIAGLLASNTVVALTALFGFLGASRHFGVYAAVSVVAATFSLVVGTVFILGGSSLLPALAGG